MEIITASQIIVQKKISTNKIEVLSIIDNSEGRNVIANIRIANKECSVLLWEGDVYDTLGQWTDDMVAERIKEINSEGNLF